MAVLVHAQGIKTVHAGRGDQKWQNSVQVVVECPLSMISGFFQVTLYQRTQKYAASFKAYLVTISNVLL